ESVDAFSPLARQQRVELAMLAPGAVPLRFDAEQMARVFGNLLPNALKFTPPGGRIARQVQDRPDRNRIPLADTGPGVPEEWRERIFDRFSQVGREATRPREGAGLGLAVCREIVKLHGGSLSVEGNRAGGASFVLELPRGGAVVPMPTTVPGTGEAASGDDDAGGSASPGCVPPPQPAQVQIPAGRRRCVLVAEDNPDLRKYIVSVLEGDYRVLDAADGEVALQLATRELPDLIVSDVVMPRRDGLSLARELRSAPATEGIPLIFLSARASDADAIAGLASGADPSLRQPFDAALPRAHVAAALHAVERLRRQLAATPVAPEAPAAELGASDRRFLEAAERWIAANLDRESATVQEFADALHVSRATLARRYGKLAGEPPIVALRRKRLERARELLARGEGNVSEVAYAVGYGSLAAFSHAYHERFGHAPSRG